MLEIEKIKDEDFKGIYELAVNKIQTKTKDWTNYQLYDPGITLVELFSWIKAAQVKEIDKTKRETILQFLKLLDVEEIHNKPSETLVKLANVKKNTTIPEGTKWLAGDLVFENKNCLNVCSAKIRSVEFNNPESFETRKREEIDGRRSYEIFGNRLTKSSYIPRVFTINFDSPLEMSSWSNIYFDTTSKWSKRRNPVKGEDDFIEMADICWEYYGLKDDVEDWHKVEEIKDKTHCFLFSDLISFRLKGEMLPVEGNYKLRATLKNSCYDHNPVLRDLSTNVFPVYQKDTVCEHKIIKKKDIRGDVVIIRTHLAIYGEHKVYVAENGSWVEKKDYASQKIVDAGCAQFQISGLSQRVADLSDDADAIMIVSYLPDKIIRGTTEWASSRGVTNQRMDIDCENLYYDDFELLVEKREHGKRSFDIWSKTSSFFMSSKHDRHYLLSTENNLLLFGDNEKGKVPDRLDKGIRIVNLSYTQGKDSNIRSGKIDKMDSENDSLQSLKIIQLTPATGGRDNESFAEMKARPLNMFNEVKRAVTYSDYETIARQTPGLIIDNIKILPGYSQDQIDEKINCVTIAVQQGDERKNERYLENYSANIKNYFEKFRLINTKIDVTGASYVGIRISGDALISSYEEDCDKQINAKVREFIKELNKNLGRTLRFSDVFGVIEQVESVVQLQNLRIHPRGDFVKLTKSDDVIIQPNGSYYIEEIRMNYYKSLSI